MIPKKNKTIIITKHGKAIAQLCPVKKSSTVLFENLHDSIKISGDIISSPSNEPWEVDKN